MKRIDANSEMAWHVNDVKLCGSIYYYYVSLLNLNIPLLPCGQFRPGVFQGLPPLLRRRLLLLMLLLLRSWLLLILRMISMDDRGGGVVDRVAGSVGIFYYVGKQHVTYLQPVTIIYPRESTY